MEELLPYLLIVLGGIFSVYTVYWGGVLISGGYELWKNKGRVQRKDISLDRNMLPKISLLIPVRNEERVVGRLIESLFKVRYPPEKTEMIFIEDGSTDGTYGIISRYIMSDPYKRIKLIHLDYNDEGKPRALNEGLKHATGDIIGLLDADCIPEPDILLKVANSYKKGKKVLVGYFKVVNAGESLMTKLAVFEELLWKFMSIGRMKLGLSVPLSGSCSFIEKDIILRAGGWRKCLAEDVDLGVRILKMGHRGHFLNSYVWLEVPNTVTSLLKQRMRWYRGYMETAIKHADLLIHAPKRIALDNLLMLSTPFFAILTLLSYALSIMSLPKSASSLAILLFVVGFIGTNVLSLILLNLGLFLVVGAEAEELAKISPLVYLYTSVLVLSSLLAFIHMALKTRPVWSKTDKSGWVDMRRLGKF